MTWVKLDDGFADHPKIRGLSDRAFRAQVGGLCYCARYLTDGHLPLVIARELATRTALHELLDQGVWHPNGDGYVIHNYLEFQPSRAQVEADRERKKEAGRLGGLASGQTRKAKHHA